MIGIQAMDQEKVRMKLNIAGEQILLSVPYSDQEHTREVEAQLNNLFNTWRGRFPEKSDRELLAMIAFQYAGHYTSLLKERGAMLEAADDASKTLDRLIEAGRNAI